MFQPRLLDDLLLNAWSRSPDALALVDGERRWSYATLAAAVESFAASLMAAGLKPGARLAIYLENRLEFVVAAFGAARCGLVFVPINPVLKQAQVRQILRDCGASLLLSSVQRLAAIGHAALLDCPDLQALWLIDSHSSLIDGGFALPTQCWPALLVTRADARQVRQCADDGALAAILYTSGSTGQPKGVMLSHRNMVIGASSVASYLCNQPSDRLLAVLPFSFDAGFSQITTAFHVGACVILHNYLLPGDTLSIMARERVTGITGVPPLFIQLAALDWPADSVEALRYFACTGGRLPRQTLDRLRLEAPKAAPFLMYGLTEAFRSTYLPPAEVDRRPDSIGQAIPNVELLVLREDGRPCEIDEPGELVHRGPLVAMGYWNDPERSAERFRPLPALSVSSVDAESPERVVFSGDTVRRDAQGFLYFIGRRDEMIKTSGYRVSPTEVEEIIYSTGLVSECVAFGVEHMSLGQVIQVIATAAADGAEFEVSVLMAECRRRMPSYMVPSGVELQAAPLPRNPNGKIDRKRLSAEWLARHQA